MSKLILSKEVYDADNKLQFKKRKLYKYDNYFTDGEMVIDFRKNFIVVGEYHITDLTENQFNSVIKPFVDEEYINKVLNFKNKVELSNITYKGNGLLMNNKKDHLIGSYYANELKGLELFYYQDKIYFFEYNTAEPEMGIDFDSYMFIGFVMGCNEKAEITKENLYILQQLQYCLSDIRGEE